MSVNNFCSWSEIKKKIFLFSRKIWLSDPDVYMKTRLLRNRIGKKIGLIWSSIIKPWMHLQNGTEFSFAAVTGYPVTTLAVTRYPVATLAVTGYPVSTLAVTGYPVATLAITGYPVSTLAVTGYPVATLVLISSELNFPFTQLCFSHGFFIRWLNG